MRIAMVSYGFAEYCILQANEMAQHHEVMLILPSNVESEHIALIDPAVVFESFHRPRYRQPLAQAAVAKWIVGKVRDFTPDVVHLQNGHMFFNAALPLLKRFPLVITIHDPQHHSGDRESRLTPQWLMNFGFRMADHVIVHAAMLKPIVSNELGFQDHQVHVVPHVAIGSRRGQASNEDSGNTLLFFGRIWDYKGLGYLIEAEPTISAEVPDLRIVIAGRGDDFDRYRTMMVHPHRFEVHNRWITDCERASLFDSASVVVLPYVDATQSGVIPVAYSFGKPVIATRVGGLPEMVDHGETGLLIPPHDSAALAAAAIELLQNRGLRLGMGRAGKEKLDRELSPDIVGRKTLEVYRKAIAE